MKFYISSQNQAAAIRLANAISRTGGQSVISESESHEPEYIISDISNNTDDSTFTIVICSNPIKVVLAANKTGYFNAVACSTANDFGTALQGGANLIALQDEPDLISDVAVALGGSYAPVQGSRKPIPKQQKPAQKTQQPRFDFPFQKRKPQQAQDDDSNPLWEKNKSIKKNLKNLFGIE